MCLRDRASMSSPGRGGHPLAMRAADTAFRCRTELAELFGLDGPENVAFTLNATHALNIAIKSLVPPGGRVVISGYEHNAVTRPLTALKTKVSVAGGPLFDQEAAVRAFDELIAPGVDVVICNHVSNVFGFVQPVEKVAALCRSRGVPLIVDASQSAGILPINMKSLGAAYIAMPGHKGLYGPQGLSLIHILGSLTGSPLLAGRGPRISVRMESVGSSSARFENQFESAGINQTKHRIVLRIDVYVSILLPGYSTVTQVTNEITVAETVIVGEVPGTYTYFATDPDAYAGDAKDYILNKD